MNKINMILFSIIFIFLQNTYGQNYSFRIGLGYGFYNMGGLENLQSEISNTYPGLDIKPVNSFPPFLNYQIQVIRKVSSKINLGLFFEFMTTGGRNAISDYSGEIRIDQIVNGYNSGLLFEKKIFERKIKNLFFTFQLSLIYSTLQVNENDKLYNQSFKNSTDFSSIGFGLEPGFSYEILSSPLIIRANLGFHVNLSKDFQLKENSNMTLQNSPDWTGLRFRVLIGYTF